jgi:hypothetical protein
LAKFVAAIIGKGPTRLVEKVLVYLFEQFVIVAKIYSNSIRTGPGSWVRIQSRREHSSYSGRIGQGFNVEEVGWIVPGRRAECRLSFRA